MGKTLSAEQREYLRILRHLLKASGAAVSEDQLLKLLQVVLEVNPWFLERATLNTGIWDKVGKNLKRAQHVGRKGPSANYSHLGAGP